MLRNVQDTNLAACVTSRNISVLKNTGVISVRSPVSGNWVLMYVLCVKLQVITD